MPLSSSEINALKQAVVEGETESVLSGLLQSIEKDSNEWTEIAQAIRLIQADYLSLKAEVIRGTVSSENARLGYNQINARILNIIHRIESGKKTLTDPVVAAPRQAWRYYVVGGVVALAIALVSWNLLRNNKTQKTTDDCPSYGEGITSRVMILPFKKGGTTQSITPEIDISDYINDLIRDDPKLNSKCESDVYESYDIEKNYPSPSEAAKTAENCGVEMIVWGKMRNAKDTVEVRYKLMNTLIKNAASNDSDVNKLLGLVDEGVWVDDIKNISKMLYLVLANQKGDQQMAVKIYDELDGRPATTAMRVMSDTARLSDTDVSKLLAKADFLRTHNQQLRAVEIYDYILTFNPDNDQALQRRGAINFDQKKYWAAARDLQRVEPNAALADTSLLKVRIGAYLNCGWPDKAREDLEQYKKRTQGSGTMDVRFIKKYEQSIADSLRVYQARLQTTQEISQQRPADAKVQLRLAQTHTALGEPDKAIQIAENVRRRKPKDPEAVKTIVEAAAQKGDIEKVNATIKEADRAGMSTKGVKFTSPTVKALSSETVPLKRSGGGN